jgi:lactate permease
MLVVPAAKHKFLLPDEIWDFPPADSWDESWNGLIRVRLDESSKSISLAKAWLPYLVIAGLLIASRLPSLGLGQWLKSFTIPTDPSIFQNVFGSNVTINAVSPLYLPGTIFILVCIMTAILHRMSLPAIGRSVARSGRMVLSASVALLFAVPMVQVFISSDGGAAGLEKMPTVLAGGVASLVGTSWPAFAPLVGGMGAFVAGSNTVSNMMFSLFQFGVAQKIGVDPIWVVALQAVGGAAGNVICVHNVVAACAVVGLMGREGDVIRITSFVFLYYILVAGIMGMIATTV